MRRWLLLIASLGLVLVWPARAWAGMPTPALTEWGFLRVSAISFFGVAFLVAAGVIRGLWNFLARDFSLPRLTYGKAVAGSTLWGLFLVVVLTMIAGARELLTPGAWQRRGPLYAVADSPPDPQRLIERKEHIERLKDALWQYAVRNGGRFPAADEKSIADGLWEVPGGAGMRYRYVGGTATNKRDALLVYEPTIHGDERLVVFTNGDVDLASPAELRRRLDAEKKP